MLISVMPICTVLKNFVGSLCKSNALFARKSPRFAALSNRTLRTLTMAISLIESTPFMTMSSRMTNISLTIMRIKICIVESMCGEPMCIRLPAPPHQPWCLKPRINAVYTGFLQFGTRIASICVVVTCFCMYKSEGQQKGTNAYRTGLSRPLCLIPVSFNCIHEAFYIIQRRIRINTMPEVGNMMTAKSIQHLNRFFFNRFFISE